MYSLVLMTAMTTAPSTADFNGFFRNAFRGGCSSASASSGCYGSSCYGSSCYGFGSRIRTFFSFGGCSGSCYGSSCYGSSCYGSSYSCNGGSSCHGSSCHGSSCHGSSCQGTYAVAPTYVAAPTYASCSGGFASPSYSCFGSSCSGYGVPSYSCSGGISYAPSNSCFGSSIASFPAVIEGSVAAAPLAPMYSGEAYPGIPQVPQAMPSTEVPTMPYSPPTAAEPALGAQKNVLPQPTNSATNRATVVVKLPTDAKLYAENQLLQLTSTERSFVTPELPTGREFSYNFRVEYDRNGRTLSESQKITVAAGRTVNVVFDDLQTPNTKTSTSTSTSKSEPVKTLTSEKPAATPSIPTPMSEVTQSQAARIIVKLPELATLYVDGQKNDRSERERTFTTPPLPPGREYAYVMSVQMPGLAQQPEQLHQKVVFKAGEIVTVDFTEKLPERKASR
jgi:uncharacterized protein (TIGR03000 family)